MKKVLIALSLALGLVALSGTAALARTTAEGPYGPAGPWADYGTCGNHWANLTTNSTYRVSPINNDGTYDVKLRASGRFVTLAGDAPGACGTTGPGTSNGDLVNAGAKGHIAFTFFLVVSGGTFDPTATCDSSCAFDGYVASYPPITDFVTTFFGQSATWSFSTVKNTLESARSPNPALCANSWSDTFNISNGATLSSSGDIATFCAV